MQNLSNIATILVIKDYSETVLYKAQFDDYLNEKTLVICENAFNQLTITETNTYKVFSIENKLFKKVADVSDFTIYTEKPNHVSIGLYDVHYAKHLILNDSNIDDVEYLTKNCNYPLPYDFADNNALSFKDEDGDIVELNVWHHDVKFSYSCGYYDTSEKTVCDFKLYCSDDVVTLHNGKKAHIDDVVWCDELDEYYMYSDCTQLENGGYLPDDMTIRTADGCYYSQNDSDISTCEGCNDHFHYEDLIYSESQDASYCESCYSEYDTERLQNRLCYSSNVINFHGFGDAEMKINGKGVFLGFELETLCYDSNVSEIDENMYDMKHGRNGFDYCIGTADGSLDDAHGIEFIFKPDSIVNHHENLKHFINNCADYLYKSAGDGYGLHVHVSNHFLTEVDKVKIQNFASLHDAKLRFIGGRGETSYQPKKAILKTDDMKQGNKNKYQAVNISPSQTIEFRFPVSLVDELHIIRNLQLALSVCLYVKYHCNYTTIANFGSFLDYLKYEKQFKILSDYFDTLEAK